MSQIRDVMKNDPDLSNLNNKKSQIEMLENAKILESILSKRLPPQRYNGFVNMWYAMFCRNATSEEIQSALVISKFN